MIRPRWRTGAAVLLLTPGLYVGLTAQPANAYCWLGDKWSTATPHELWADTTISSTWSTHIDAMRQLWNAPSKWRFSTYYPPGYYGPPYRGGWIAYVDLESSGIDSIPAATQSNWGTDMQWADTYLSDDWTWNTTGTMSESLKKADLRTVVLHELGHWLSLDHPNQCDGGVMTTAEVAAVMNANWTSKQTLRADDNSGAAAIYP